MTTRLSPDAQEEAAARKIGAGQMEIANAADWMRLYFRRVSAVHRVCAQMSKILAARSSLYRQLRDSSKIASEYFSVVGSLIFPKQPSALQDPGTVLGLFDFMAKHGLTLSGTLEHDIERATPVFASTHPRGSDLWLYLERSSPSLTPPMRCAP